MCEGGRLGRLTERGVRISCRVNKEQGTSKRPTKVGVQNVNIYCFPAMGQHWTSSMSTQLEVQ